MNKQAYFKMMMYKEASVPETKSVEAKAAPKGSVKADIKVNNIKTTGNQKCTMKKCESCSDLMLKKIALALKNAR